MTGNANDDDISRGYVSGHALYLAHCFLALLHLHLIFINTFPYFVGGYAKYLFPSRVILTANKILY